MFSQTFVLHMHFLLIFSSIATFSISRESKMPEVTEEEPKRRKDGECGNGNQTATTAPSTPTSPS
jgi:hypothetical protein